MSGAGVSLAPPGGGLSREEAARRRAQHGPNALPEQKPVPTWRRLLRQFASPLVAILLVALVLDLVLWFREGAETPPVEALAIGAILLLNAFLGFWQERKAERALGELRQLGAPTTSVVRDGTLVELPNAELVPGDLVRINAGDRVPADLAIRQAQSLMLDEAVLTGESVPVGKRAGDEGFSGTLAVKGRAWGEVTRIGPTSAMGQVAGLIAGIRPEPTPLQRRLERFGRVVALVIVGLAAVIALTGIALEGASQAPRILLVAVALAVAAVPEGLPAAITFVLALGVERMARRNAVVRRLSAVEALGSVTVIVTDKTGTLTANRMKVGRFDPTDRDQALRAIALANDADPASGVGDPMDVALAEFVEGHGIDLAVERRNAPRVEERPFDSEWGFVRATVERNGRRESWVKGAPEAVLSRCELDPGERQRWHDRAHQLGSDGLRALGLAAGPGAREDGLQWLGLVGLWDPPRPEAPDAVRRARDAGVRVIIATGDHPATAQAVARDVGLDAEPVVLGAELDQMDDHALGLAVRHTALFARVAPAQKVRIVEALREAGAIVAVTGDGVNDAPALKRAHVGVAMGQRGAAVSREVADLVLLDDNFATIVAAIEEGRSIFRNIRKFIRFLFSTNLSEVIVVAGGFVAALALDLREAGGALLLPLTAVQLLWINLVTDGAPAMALALDRNPGVMTAPPRPAGEQLLDRHSLRFIVAAGGFKAILGTALLLVLPLLGEPPEAIRTALFVFLASGQVLFAYPARRARIPPAPNPVLHGAVIFGFLLQPALVLLPWLRTPLELQPFGLAASGVVAAGILLSWAGAELVARHR